MEHFELYTDMMMSPEFDGEDSDSDDTLDSLLGDAPGTQRSTRKRSSKPCKYVPHAEKPVHLVQRRNARERRRVQAVNSAFIKLRKIVPYENKHKRLSKVKTLRTAIDYIRQLQGLIQEYDCSQQSPQPPAVYGSASPPSYQENPRWMQHQANLPEQNYAYCSNDDSRGHWTSCYNDGYLQIQHSQTRDSLYSQPSPISNHHYGYQQEHMYTHRAVAHLASVS